MNVGLSRGAKVTASLAALLMMLSVSVLVVKASYGAFASQYSLVGYFPRTGNGLHVGSEIQHNGVTVGQISSIALVRHKAQVQMEVQQGFAVPNDANAVITPKNVFGEEVVDLRFAGNDGTRALAAGATVAHVSVDDQLTELLAAADPLLNAINGQDLGTVVGELSVAAQGEGPTIAKAFDEGTKLANLLSDTVGAQINALQAFTGFTEALAPTGPALNQIANESNVFLPTFNAQAAAYQKVLEAFTPVANELAAYLSAYRPQINTILGQGDNVVRVLIAHQSDIADLIHGLYRYTFKFANGLSPETLSNGTHFAYFKTFILFSDINNLVCGLVAPSQSGLSFLKPLQQALLGPSSPFDCSAQLASFNRAQGQSTAVAGIPGKGPTTPALPGAQLPSVPSAGQAAQQLANQLGTILGTPNAPSATNTSNALGAIMSGLLGGL
jgi:virulence factor Mce-like protein